MNGLKLSPVFLSTLVLAAHFYRAGLFPLVIICLVFPAILIFRTKWAVITVQILLLFGGMEWLRTLYFIAQERIAEGMPWTRLAVILGFVALITACSALVFRFKSIRKLFNLTS